MIQVTMVAGDEQFMEWESDAWGDLSKREHELRVARYRKVEQYSDYMNSYVVYKKKKKRVMLTLCHC